MKLQIKKISIYCLVILGILLVSVIPVMAQDVNAAQTITDAAKAGPQNVAEIIKNFLITKGTAFAVDLLAAILIFAIGRWLAKWASILVGRAMTRAHIEQILVTFVQHLCYFGLLAFVIIAALDQIGIKLTAAIAVLGAAALAVAFALQGSLSNFAAGILMVIFKPFKIGDYVTVAGIQGTVREIQILNTVLDSLDNVRIIIPNAQITGSTISNYTTNATRRIDLTVGISYGDDIKKAKQVIEGVLAADARILKTPAPTVAVSELADSSVKFVVRPWVKSADYWDVYFDTTAKLKTTLENNGITMPFPQREISIKNAGKINIGG
ncbi:MAG: mechanosensitive ion channel domain-containing protein [Sedimentisphaerales bacterium]|jgi:small conductance mechanosensitive channel